MAKLTSRNRILALAGICFLFVVCCRAHTILTNDDYEALKAVMPHKGYYKQMQMIQQQQQQDSDSSSSAGEVSPKVMEDPDVYSTKIPCKRVYSGFFLPDKLFLDGAKLLDNNYKKNHKLYICVD